MSRDEVCTTRPKWRSGRRETAVKVYTVNQESKYISVKNVPALGAENDLLRLFSLYGTILEYKMLDDCKEVDQFTDAYWIKYGSIDEARNAKRKLDDYYFLGSCLVVAYAPEYESIQETSSKLQERRMLVGRLTHQPQTRSRKRSPRHIDPPVDRGRTYVQVESYPPTEFEKQPLPVHIHHHLSQALEKMPASSLETQSQQQNAQMDRHLDRVNYGGLDKSVDHTVVSIRRKLQKLEPSVRKKTDSRRRI